MTSGALSIKYVIAGKNAVRVAVDAHEDSETDSPMSDITNDMLKLLPWNIITKEAGNLGIDRDLVGAMIMCESSGMRSAARFEPKFNYLYSPDAFAARLGITRVTEEVFQKTSWGYMQVMGAVARELGFENMLPELISPILGIRFGCMKLKKLLDKYGYIRPEDAVAAYNAGSPRRHRDGGYVNQRYVTKVMRLKMAFEEIAS